LSGSCAEVWSVAIFSLGLIAAMLIQVRVGLMPLHRVSEALGRIREGRARQLEGEFPSEIAPLAVELNGLIAHSSEVVGRARAHVANLAHFLKTPLTVLANEAAANSGPLADTVTEMPYTQLQALIGPGFPAGARMAPGGVNPPAGEKMFVAFALPK
jgi:signal transduction histidine kinase